MGHTQIFDRVGRSCIWPTQNFQLVELYVTTVEAKLLIKSHLSACLIAVVSTGLRFLGML